MKRSISLLFCLLFLVLSCHKVPITGRKQVKLLPRATVNQLAFSQYSDFLSTNKVVPASDPRTQMVKRVGDNIRKGVERYFKEAGKSSYLQDYAWEFNLVDDPSVNAWCMPGGKVVIYTGILPITKDEDGLAVVMGHEIAHAIANHGNERMSQGLAANFGGVALDVLMSQQPDEARQLASTAYGIGAQVGVLLPFSRLHESEADEMGLYFMAMAGYNPEAAVPFWTRMSQAGGAQPPQFLSTHPSHQTRIKNLQDKMMTAKAYATRFGPKK